uniref:Uncharacterized protein n=1 Tax=Anguilla anguilla TaxID=7936 RepID=A0A0E9UES6_ANGAN
MGVGVTNS